MAYTTYSEIEADFKDLSFTTTSNVKIADVTQFIVEADSLINSYIGGRYVTPMTGAGEGLSLLKLLSRSLVAARIKKIMEVKTEKSPDPSQNVVGVLLSMTQVIKILSDIKDDVIMLAGATLLSSTQGFYASNYADSVEPVMQKSVKQW